MMSSKVRDAEGFYRLPTDTGDLLGLVASGISAKNLAQLQTLLAEIPSGDLSIDHLDFLPDKKAAAILAAIELGRRLWSTPTPRLSKIDSPQEAYKCFCEILRGKTSEHFVVIFLDSELLPAACAERVASRLKGDSIRQDRNLATTTYIPSPSSSTSS